MAPGQLEGQWVEVTPETFIGRPNSEGGTGVVTAEHPDGSFDIKYTLGGSEKNVARRRIKSFNPLVTSARQRNANDVTRPSHLAPSHQPEPAQAPRRASPTPSPPTSPRGVSLVILQSLNWSKYDNTPNPLLVYLHNGYEKEQKGWLRLVENEYDKYENGKNGKKKGEMKKQLSAKENNKLVTIKSELDRIRSAKAATSSCRRGTGSVLA